MNHCKECNRNFQKPIVDSDGFEVCEFCGSDQINFISEDTDRN